MSEISNWVWGYLAGPALALAGLALLFLLRSPHLRRLPDAFRRHGERVDVEAPERQPSALATVALSSTLTIGVPAIAALGLAMSDASVGLIPYLWLFALLLGPLRYAETWLARTRRPGAQERTARGSLLARIAGESRQVSLVFAVILVIVSVVGIAHATALEGFTHDLAPMVAAIGAAVFGLFFTLTHPKTQDWLSWIAIFSLLGVLVFSIVGVASAPGPAFGALGSSFKAAFEGAYAVGDHLGATPKEILIAALCVLLPIWVASLGLDGAIQSMGRAPTREQVAISALSPFAAALLGTLLCMGVAGTGALGELVEGEASLEEVRFYSLPAASLSQRLEMERRYSGVVRIREGLPRNPRLFMATESGPIAPDHFYRGGELANIALRIDDQGQAQELMEPGQFGALELRDPSELSSISLRGEVLPRGPRLLSAYATKVGGDLGGRIWVALLLALGTAGFGALGIALRRSYAAIVSEKIAMGLASLPMVLGIAAVAMPGLFPHALASLAIALLALSSALFLVIKGREIQQLDR